MAAFAFFLPFILTASASAASSEIAPWPCDHEVYCKPGTDDNPSLLHVVQMARIFPDSKTFVDMPIKGTVQGVLENFDNFIKEVSWKKVSSCLSSLRDTFH